MTKYHIQHHISYYKQIKAMHHPATTPVRPTASNTNEIPPPTSTHAEEIGESTNCNTNIDDSVIVAKKAPNFKEQEDALLARAYAKCYN